MKLPRLTSRPGSGRTFVFPSLRWLALVLAAGLAIGCDRAPSAAPAAPGSAAPAVPGPAAPAANPLAGTWRLETVINPDGRSERIQREGGPSIVWNFSRDGEFFAVTNLGNGPQPLAVTRGTYQAEDGKLLLTIQDGLPILLAPKPARVAFAVAGDKLEVKEPGMFNGGLRGIFTRYQPPTPEEVQAAAGGVERARKRSQGTTMKNDLRLIADAKDQYAIEQNKANVTPVWADLTPYLKPGSKLATQTTPTDLLGNPYKIGDLATPPKISDATYRALSDVCDAAFWSPFK